MRGNPRQPAQPLQQILDVLDLASKGELIVVPDTNALLATTDPVDYRKVTGQDSFVFMLLPTVLGELDRLKIEHRNDVVREKAKKIITRIKGWRNQGSLAGGVVVDKSIVVKASHSEPDMDKTLSWLDADNRDDRIVASVLALQGEYPSAHVILVSDDINLLNKADAALIDTADAP
jgi:predicted ribonuclease YlaK